jgi:ABC-type lipoprotein release transport system permease subunit
MSATLDRDRIPRRHHADIEPAERQHLAAALVLLRSLQSLLFDVTPYDVTTYVSVVLLLCAVAAVASYVPARHASRVQPLLALRDD